MYLWALGWTNKQRLVNVELVSWQEIMNEDTTNNKDADKMTILVVFIAWLLSTEILLLQYHLVRAILNYIMTKYCIFLGGGWKKISTFNSFPYTHFLWKNQSRTRKMVIIFLHIISRLLGNLFWDTLYYLL